MEEEGEGELPGPPEERAPGESPLTEERTVTLIGGGASCAAARDFVRNCLAETLWAGDADAAVLLTSELVANAARHAGGPCRLRLQAGEHLLRVEAADRSPRSPRVRHPEPYDEGGRGMLLVEVLASRWGVEQQRSDGKVIWFELRA